MTHVRSKAAIGMVAILLASCTAVDDRYASRSAEAPPQTSQESQTPAESTITHIDTRVPYAPPPPPPPPPVASADASITVTGTRVARPDFHSSSPAVAVNEALLQGT